MMQQYPLLQTKLYIPLIRPELVPRPRLIERLNAGLGQNGFQESLGFGRKLTLLSAPAGFGKTTLVSEWVQTMGDAIPPIAVAWLSLDEGDNDPARFLAYLIAALRALALGKAKEIEPQHEHAAQQAPVGLIGEGVLSALQSPQPPPRQSVLTPLINEIAAYPGSIILVLDDHHAIQASAVDNALAFLLERLPSQMHLVIATREDPHLPLARLRARGQLTELRASDLRFTSSEAAEFLNQVMGLDLSAEHITALEARTEGWIAGLQLAAISMQGRKDVAGFVQSFAGSHHFVLDYLVEEVLAQQSERVQTFLLRTSVLDRLTGSLCDAVRSGCAEPPSSSSGSALTGQDNGQAILEMLEHANLFIVPLDDERRWYRYHYLFADLLRQRLRQTQSDQLPILHHRASEWYEQNGFTDEAIEHALRAEYFERAADLLQDHADALWQRGEYRKLQHWLARLPGELVVPNPYLGILQAWYLAGDQQDAAEWHLQVAEKALGIRPVTASEFSAMERDQSLNSEWSRLQGRIATIRAFLASYQGDVQGIETFSRQALDYLPQKDLIWRNTATVALGEAYALKGDMAAAYRVRLEALEASKAAGNIYMILIASLKLAFTVRQQGQLGQTVEICQQQIRLADESGLSTVAAAGCSTAMWGETLAELRDGL